MFRLDPRHMEVIVQIKMKDIDRDLDLSDKDKEQVKAYYKRRLAAAKKQRK